MELPSIITVEGAYNYLIATLLAIALLLAVYVVASFLGLAPSPTEIVTWGPP